MNEQEILEGNKLIAEFMGMKLDTSIYFGDTDYEWRTSSVIPFRSWRFENPPPFNSDWNWLMTVIKRIKDIQSDNLEIQKRYSILMDFMTTMDIELIYNSGVLEFIKWYNIKHN